MHDLLANQVENRLHNLQKYLACNHQLNHRETPVSNQLNSRFVVQRANLQINRLTFRLRNRHDSRHLNLHFNLFSGPQVNHLYNLSLILLTFLVCSHRDNRACNPFRAQPVSQVVNLSIRRPNLLENPVFNQLVNLHSNLHHSQLINHRRNQLHSHPHSRDQNLRSSHLVNRAYNQVECHQPNQLSSLLVVLLLSQAFSQL
mmetsp:Transcript_10188/g.14018  ORF Transcript_10188/g.14018 Transcript_10188/m.14018 type:complete len:201 (+) Transcript_10188:774-1376(+)